MRCKYCSLRKQVLTHHANNKKESCSFRNYYDIAVIEFLVLTIIRYNDKNVNDGIIVISSFDCSLSVMHIPKLCFKFKDAQRQIIDINKCILLLENQMVPSHLIFLVSNFHQPQSSLPGVLLIQAGQWQLLKWCKELKC